MWYCFVVVPIVYSHVDDFRCSPHIKVFIKCCYHVISTFKNKSKELSNPFLHSKINPSRFLFNLYNVVDVLCIIFLYCLWLNCILCDVCHILEMDNKTCCTNSWDWESSMLFPEAGIYSCTSSDTINVWLACMRVL